MLTALLMQRVAKLGVAEVDKDGQSETCDITVADIIGPLLLKEVGTRAEAPADCSNRARDARFSLLSYSFSLVGRAPAATLNSAPLMGPHHTHGAGRRRYNADGRTCVVTLAAHINAPPICRACRTRRFATSSASR